MLFIDDNELECSTFLQWIKEAFKADFYIVHMKGLSTRTWKSEQKGNSHQSSVKNTRNEVKKNLIHRSR